MQLPLQLSVSKVVPCVQLHCLLPVLAASLKSWWLRRKQLQGCAKFPRGASRVQRFGAHSHNGPSAKSHTTQARDLDLAPSTPVQPQRWPDHSHCANALHHVYTRCSYTRRSMSLDAFSEEAKRRGRSGTKLTQPLPRRCQESACMSVHEAPAGNPQSTRLSSFALLTSSSSLDRRAE